MPISRSKKLMKNTIIISIGKICTSVITFLLLPLYTTILNTEEYGVVDLLDTLMALLLPIISLQIEQGVFRELLENRKSNTAKRETISTGFFSILIQCSIATLFFAILRPLIHNQYLLFLLLNVLAYVLVEFLQQVARGLGEINKYTFGSFINAVSTIGFNIVLLVIFRMNVYGMLLGTFLGFCITILYYLCSLHFFSYINYRLFKKPTLKMLLRYSLPLVPNTLAWWVFSASDRVIVSTILGLDANGILAASLKFSAISTTVYHIFHISWTESMSLAINDEDAASYFNKTTDIILKLFVSFSFILIAVIPFIFSFLVNPAFYKAYYLIPPSVLAALFNIMSGLVSTLYIARRNTAPIARTSIVAALLNILIHLSLIRFIGLFAAVISTLITYIILSLYRIIDAKRRYFRITFDKRFVTFSFITAIFILLSYYVNNPYINILSAIISIMFAITINSPSLNFIKNSIMHFLSKKGKPHEH